MDLAGFDAAAFLRDDWQTRPRLIRGAWPGWTNPLAPDDLAGLACEEGVSARIVERGKHRLKVAHGPFKSKHFARLGAKPWTVLVDAVDHAVPAVAALLTAFAFVPAWRIDDVMVSYASDGGGVGAHFDRYDVFLIQGLGQRRWRIGARCDAATPRVPHDDLNLVAGFVATDEWVLDPGDMLYLPPGIAHEGVAVGDDCMTYSVGFRAPARSELIAHWCDHLLAELDDDDRYSDADIAVPANPGEIAPAAIARLHEMVIAGLADRTAFARWFGAFTTAPRVERETACEALPAAIAGRSLRRDPASRFGFIRYDGGLALFVDGASFDCSGAAAAFAAALCADPCLTIDPAWDTAEVRAVMTALLAAGSVTLG